MYSVVNLPSEPYVQDRTLVHDYRTSVQFGNLILVYRTSGLHVAQHLIWAVQGKWA